ncbi:unnamed protein product [Somion occarium]|uniref:Chromo domain-containing protein n=1 Tax=Somion occarium TaxID=3059160 RepID=A0ABP1E7M2_9APHY
MSYLVKWKGYPDSENSYVDENDAKGAQDLIDAYWKRNKKGPKPKGRKSAVSPREESEEVETSQPPPKKRGRPPKARTPETPSEEEAEEERPKAKKPKAAPRKSTEAAKRRKSQPTAEEEENGLDEELGNMKKWLDAASWEHLVDTIDTVERTKDNELYVYFTLNNKSAKKSGFRRCREKSAICKEKMPMKLLDFYESNLRWREDTDEP